MKVSTLVQVIRRAAVEYGVAVVFFTVLGFLLTGNCGKVLLTIFCVVLFVAIFATVIKTIFEIV